MQNPLNIIFAGSPPFALESLKRLNDSPHDILAVYTQPDRPSGRGQKLTASAVKLYAQEKQLPLFQPQHFNDQKSIKTLQELQADVMVVVAYGLLLPESVLNSPRFGCINVHASLLPRWRGASPIQHAILTGDRETGVSVMQMDQSLDTGPILYQQSCEIKSNDTSARLHDRLATLGSEALLHALNNLQNNGLVATAQDEKLACYAPKLNKQSGLMVWQQTAEHLERQVRAYNPWPVAYTFIADQVLRIWHAELIDETSHAAPGQIIQSNKHGIDVATGEKQLRLLHIQLPNGKKQSVSDVLNAKRDWFKPGVQLGQGT